MPQNTARYWPTIESLYRNALKPKMPMGTADISFVQFTKSLSAYVTMTDKVKKKVCFRNPDQDKFPPAQQNVFNFSEKLIWVNFG